VRRRPLTVVLVVAATIVLTAALKWVDPNWPICWTCVRAAQPRCPPPKRIILRVQRDGTAQMFCVTP
jgi:hypothetical protein